MNVKACIYTDIGQTRKVNQDASLIKVANSKNHGRITLIAVCDGMGGLSKGEVASCKAVRALELWFHEELVLMLTLLGDELFDAIENSWRRLVAKINSEITRYGKHRGITLGTTLTALLQIGSKYICMNVGDSRIYSVEAGEVALLTRDQSVVQDKIDRGLISTSEAMSDDQKNVLLQCLGTRYAPIPDIRRGIISRNTTMIACSDGFWRTVGTEEIRQHLCPQMCLTDEDMLRECKKLVNKAISRDEDDNISVAAACLEF